MLCIPMPLAKTVPTAPASTPVSNQRRAMRIAATPRNRGPESGPIVRRSCATGQSLTAVRALRLRSRWRAAARGPALPAVAQLAQPDEHGARVRLLTELGKGLAQPRDDGRVLQPEEGVDALFLAERGHGHLLGALALHPLEQCRRVAVARL